MKIFRPEDFGAIADGINNDAIAVWKAIDSATKYDGEAKVLFADNKTYRFGPTDDQKSGKHQMMVGGLRQEADSLNCTAPFPISGAKDVHFKGNNTTLLIDPPFNYCNMFESENVMIEGFNFDYSYHPFVKGTMIDMDYDKHTAVFKTDRSLRIRFNN